MTDVSHQALLEHPLLTTAPTSSLSIFRDWLVPSEHLLVISTMTDSSFKTGNLHAPLCTQCLESGTQILSWVSARRPTACLKACLKSQSLGRGSNRTRSSRPAWATQGALPQKGKCWRKSGALNVSGLNYFATSLLVGKPWQVPFTPSFSFLVFFFKRAFT